jgi:hypothetical protein
VKKSKIKYKVIIPRNSKKNRKNLVKSKLKYSDYSESEKENNSIKKRK